MLTECLKNKLFTSKLSKAYLRNEVTHYFLFISIVPLAHISLSCFNKTSSYYFLFTVLYNSRANYQVLSLNNKHDNDSVHIHSKNNQRAYYVQLNTVEIEIIPQKEIK